MLTKPTISQHLADQTNSALLAQAQTVAALIDGNLNYPTPNPALVDFAALIADFSDAIIAWGDVHNRGSHAQKLTVDSTREAVEGALTALANYCMNTTPYDEAAFVSAGFSVRPANAPVGLVGPVQNFRQFINYLVPSGAVKLNWKRPLATKPGDIAAYKVMHSLTADINAATQLALTTKATFTDLEAGNRPSNFYWIIPVCTAGNGGIADSVQGYPQGPVVG